MLVPNPPPNPLAYVSNPVLGGDPRSIQVLDQPLWTQLSAADPAKRSVCGRCLAVPPKWHLYFKWGDNPPTMSTTKLAASPDLLPEAGDFSQLPVREDWWYIFDNISLLKQAIRQPGDDYVQNVDKANISDYYGTEIPPTPPFPYNKPLGPPLAYTCHNWMNPVRQLGSVRQAILTTGSPPETSIISVLNPIPNLQWVLTYVKDLSAITGPVPDTIESVDTSMFVNETDVLDLPSESDGYSGWVLALVRRKIGGGETDGGIFVRDLSTSAGGLIPELFPPGGTTAVSTSFRPYATYRLYRTDEEKTLAETEAVSDPTFNCRGPNIWELAFNPLMLRPHLIHMIPMGP